LVAGEYAPCTVWYFTGVAFTIDLWFHSEAVKLRMKRTIVPTSCEDLILKPKQSYGGTGVQNGQCNETNFLRGRHLSLQYLEGSF